ncbi:MAG: class I SAM-dependent methyltransferase, partial [Candidatus Binatia bacterium]
LMRLIARLKPATVLEVGCGNGLNLFILAGRFPGIRFTGIELTTGGVAAAEAVRALPELPQAVQDFAPEPLLDPKPFDRIEILCGNAAALPFPDRSFDLLMTSLALEQMEQIRPRALAEIARVAKSHTAMVEPFFEWNATGSRRDYIVANDYFSGRISDLPGFGLTPVFSTADMPCKLINHPGLVVCSAQRARRALPS